jgi:hypothetical protein
VLTLLVGALLVVVGVDTLSPQLATAQAPDGFRTAGRNARSLVANARRRKASNLEWVGKPETASQARMVRNAEGDRERPAFCADRSDNAMGGPGEPQGSSGTVRETSPEEGNLRRGSTPETG